MTGVRPLRRLLEVAELRVHEGSPLAGRSLAETQLRTRTGVNVVGRWREGHLEHPPAPAEAIPPGTILVAVGTPEAVGQLGKMARPIREEGLIVVVGFGSVGRKLAEILRAVDEQLLVVDPAEASGVDVRGDVTEPAILDQLPLADARVVILALDTDAQAVFAATALRDHAPDLPIIAAVRLSDNVARIQRAGADFALSVSQVAGQLLAHHVLDVTVSLQPRIKLARVDVGRLAGKSPFGEKIRERTGCTVVAVERGGEVIMSLTTDFRLAEGDVMYLCGTAEALASYHERYPAEWL